MHKFFWLAGLTKLQEYVHTDCSFQLRSTGDL